MIPSWDKGLGLSISIQWHHKIQNCSWGWQILKIEQIMGTLEDKILIIDTVSQNKLKSLEIIKFDVHFEKLDLGSN